MDSIHLEGIEVLARIGVPEEERATAQRLSVSLTLWPATTFDRLDDQIAQAVDYAAVCAAVRKLVSDRSDRLIETLASAIASQLLDIFPVVRVWVEVRKFVLPEVKYVAVSVTRERAR